ncbi:carbon-nitrogen hydrolase family protein [Paenarthrobacter aurescens]|jgi:nitrilase|uniref:Nitrilase n=2 Tax=Paenarthrobacter aurescens TaxID=43663 RepID=S5M6X9_PAEAU|nr:carbon-nitrogen hydrolase family protein [Paenarthrobacter aurescens]ABM08899.1 putative nitrilase [Paenarthrobacter aurescens TC1]AGR27778.1 nitrilase [Paenarthrobacter aurescens]QVV41493.1 nitrilase [synthetic construct]
MTKVAVVQAASVPFDAQAAVDKAVDLIRECAESGAELAVFPEAFIGGYPKGSTFGSTIGNRSAAGRKLFEKYYSAAITLDGNEVTQLVTASRESNVFVVVGVIERLGNTLYCTALMISPDGGLVGKHRKLMPTSVERLVWGFGDGSTLDVVDSPAGRVGTVICWENYMPLLRQAMYAQGVEIYCAPTADDRPSWQHSMVHIAIEGRVFVLSACQTITKDAYPADYEFEFEIGNNVMHGGSMIVDPLGNVLAGPVFDEETILYADVELSKKRESHLDMDITGNYARPDVFSLSVDTKAKNSVEFNGAATV